MKTWEIIIIAVAAATADPSFNNILNFDSFIPRFLILF